jgi:hypothetical protein
MWYDVYAPTPTRVRAKRAVGLRSMTADWLAWGGTVTGCRPITWRALTGGSSWRSPSALASGQHERSRVPWRGVRHPRHARSTCHHQLLWWHSWWQPSARRCGRSSSTGRSWRHGRRGWVDLMLQHQQHAVPVGALAGRRRRRRGKPRCSGCGAGFRQLGACLVCGVHTRLPPVLPMSPERTKSSCGAVFPLRFDTHVCEARCVLTAISGRPCTQCGPERVSAATHCQGGPRRDCEPPVSILESVHID